MGFAVLSSLLLWKDVREPGLVLQTLGLAFSYICISNNDDDDGRILLAFDQ